MSFKVFTNGSVLNASELNEFLMNQSVIAFSNSTARASAIPSPVEGMLTYLEDTNAYQFWNGSAWQALIAGGAGSGNAIINGAFEVNQRNFSSTTSSFVFGFDRWKTAALGGTTTFSSQAFTLGSAPVAGYEAANYQRIVSSGQSGSGDYSFLIQPIESVRTFANQQITVSFWARANTGTPKIAIEMRQDFGTGGSPSPAVEIPGGAVTVSTAWTRYSATLTVPSIAGKTIGTDRTDSLQLNLWVSAGSTFNTRASSIGLQANTFDIWGVQVEAGTSATAFRRNADSFAGELAACQRYFERMATNDHAIATLQAVSSTAALGSLRYQTKRGTPSIAHGTLSQFGCRNASNSASMNPTSISIFNVGLSALSINPVGNSVLSAGNATEFFLGGGSGNFLDVIAEL